MRIAYPLLSALGLTATLAVLLPPPAAGLPAPAGKPEVITNGLGMKLAPIAKGEFMMGSPDSDADAASSEKPQHRVIIARPFRLGVHPVTRGQFKAFVEATGYQTEAETSGQGGYGFNTTTKNIDQRPVDTWKTPGFEQTDEHPIVNVSWHDAVTFCNWLSKKEGKRYRLPTEAEWEYACRAGSTTRFPTGDASESLKGLANVADQAMKARFAQECGWTFMPWDDGWAFTAPVGKYKPNAWGLYDLPGNVWNWCSDWYAEDYYTNSPAHDPRGPDQGEYRVIRGGGWGRDVS